MVRTNQSAKPGTVDDAHGFLHVRVRNEVRETISRMAVGEKLPPERCLSERFKVNRATIRRAMLDLEKEGFVVRHQGRGTFVNKTLRLGMATGRGQNTIGMSIVNFDLPNSREILEGVDEEATRRGYGVLVGNCEFDPVRERENLARFKNRNLDGIIVVPFAGDSLDPEYDALLDELREQGTRVVLTDIGVSSPSFPSVMSNRVMMGYMATQHLILLGHRRIGYVTTGRFDTSGRDCLRGYRSALEDYGIEYDETRVVEHPLHLCAGPVHDRMIAMLRETPRVFTAVATDVFSMTYGILKALGELGVRVPEDMAVVGADVELNPEYAYVTHTAQSFREMGRLAVQLLLRAENEPGPEQVLLPPRLVIGTTCGFSVGSSGKPRLPEDRSNT